MAISRTSILRGPAKVTYNSATFLTKGDITVDIIDETFDIVTSIHGLASKRRANRRAEIKFTPAGEWENLAVLWPYASTLPGASIFTGTDIPLNINSLVDGKQLQFTAAAVTTMPVITCSAVNTLIGEVTFTALGKNNTDWTAPNSFATVSTSAYADATFSESAILTKPFSLAWGSAAGFTAFQTLDGVKVDFDLKLNPLEVDNDGIVDYIFESLMVSATCKPVTASGLTMENLLTASVLDGVASAARGESLATRVNSADLVITGAGAAPVITLKQAAITKSQMRFGAQSARIGDVVFSAQRTFNSGVPGVLFVLAP